jgi:hypothetical protein
MARGFRRGVWTVLFGEVVAAVAVLTFSPKAREAARPYLVKGIRGALGLGDEFKRMIDEARLEAARVSREVEAKGVLANRR